jgi:simple sugar transport system permease protein
VPVSSDVAASAKLPVFWGDPELQGLHIGIFIALAAAVVFWVLLNRSTTGYEVRAVGFNPEAARYGGISVSRNYILVMAVCGAFAGLAGSVDLLGWQFHIATNDILNSANVGLGFFGIAVALLGRNTASGTVVAALLFGALLTGTSQRNLDPTIFEPELAGNLTLIIQGLVVLIVSADVIVFNVAAKKIMDESGIQIDDLYALVKPRLEELQMPANVHFKNEGYDVLAQQVAQSILKALESR